MLRMPGKLYRKPLSYLISVQPFVARPSSRSLRNRSRPLSASSLIEGRIRHTLGTYHLIPFQVGSPYYDALASARSRRSLATAARPSGRAIASLLRHACGYKLSRDDHDTRALQAYLGHKNIQHTVRYTELAPTRFKNFWRD